VAGASIGGKAVEMVLISLGVAVITFGIGRSCISSPRCGAGAAGSYYVVRGLVLGSMSAQSVMRWVREHGLKWRLVRLPTTTATVRDAARALGVPPSNIVKTIVVVAGGKFYAVVLPGDRKLDLKKLEKIVGSKPRLANPREVLEATGYPVGGVPPVALPPHVTLIVDEELLKRDRVYGGGGEDGVLLEFSPRELVEVVKPVVAKVFR